MVPYDRIDDLDILGITDKDMDEIMSCGNLFDSSCGMRKSLCYSTC